MAASTDSRLNCSALSCSSGGGVAWGHSLITGTSSFINYHQKRLFKVQSCCEAAQAVRVSLTSVAALTGHTLQVADSSRCHVNHSLHHKAPLSVCKHTTTVIAPCPEQKYLYYIPTWPNNYGKQFAHNHSCLVCQCKQAQLYSQQASCLRGPELSKRLQSFKFQKHATEAKQRNTALMQ